MCALWFLRDFRNPTRTARGHEQSAAPAREWFFAAAVIRCTWHSRRSRFTAAKPLPSTLWRWDGEERFKTGEVSRDRLQDRKDERNGGGLCWGGMTRRQIHGSDDPDSPLRKSKNKTERLKRSVCGGVCC